MTNTVGMGDPGATGRFGEFGGRYVPETLIPACEELEVAFRDAWVDPAFRSELDGLLADYAGRPSPLTEAHRLSEELGCRVLLKREDLNHTGSHKIVETTHYCLGSVMGPHPYPWMVREFHRVIGDEAYAQVHKLTGADPDVVVACVGGGSNAAGIFSGFVDTEAELVGAEPAGGAAIGGGAVGVVHGMASYLKQDDVGQVMEAHSISAGLDYPGVGPEHSFLAAEGRARYEPVTDAEVIEAFVLLSRTEGIIPALEPAHALAWVAKAKDELAGKTVLINLSGRGDKDVAQMMEVLG